MIVPKPVKVEIKIGEFELDGQVALTAGAGTESEARQLAEGLRAPTGFKLPVLAEASPGKSITLTLEKSLASRLGDEGYLLSVTPRRVVIRAAGLAGLFYGGQTFRQLLPPEVFSREHRDSAQPIRWLAPGLEIEDYPRFHWRGLLLDVARHYFPPEFLKKLVDELAIHKLNMLQLHLTDDQGWRIEIKKYPLLTQIGSVRQESPKRRDPSNGDGTPYGPFFYTQDQIRDLVAYAQARHVTVVPEIEMPGHFRGALAAYPQISCTGGPFAVRTRWGIEPDILCAGNDQAIAFAKDVLAEVADIFPSKFIHIGGDEAPKERWKKCPQCQARIKAEGLANEEQLQGWFNHQIEDFLADKGRRLIGWDEILAGGLPPRAAVMSWRGTEGGVAAAESGHDVVMSPTSHCYLDYAQAKGPAEPESIGGFIPLRMVYEFEPMPSRLPLDKQKHIMGAQGNVWTEFIWLPQEAEYFAFPRAAALAEVVWSPADQRQFDDFHHRLEYHLKRLDQLKVNYRKLEGL